MKPILYVSFMVILFGCGNPQHEFQSQPGSEDALKPTVLLFADVQRDVLEPGRCVRCHSPGGDSPDLATYESIMASAGLVAPGDPDGSRLYRVLARGLMPPSGPLDSLQIEIVRRWISEGARAEL